MIVSRYLTKEISHTLLGVILVLLLVFVSGSLVRLLYEAAEGGIPAEAIFALLVLNNITTLEMLLPLALYLAVLLGLGRLYKDSEMTALAACGVGNARILRTVFRFSLVIALMTAALSLQIAPWAEGQLRAIMAQAAANVDVRGIVAGRFLPIKGQDAVLYVESVDKEKLVLHNVFVQQAEDSRLHIMTANSGYQYTDGETGQRFLVLEDGQRYQIDYGGGYAMLEFERHTLLIRASETSGAARRRKARDSLTLWRSPETPDRAELQRRLSMALWAVVLGVMAVPLSHTSPRQGRYARVLVAIIIFVLYSNLLNIAKTWMEDGTMPAAIGLWWVHGIMGLLTLGLLLQEAGVLSSWRVRSEARRA